MTPILSQWLLPALLFSLAPLIAFAPHATPVLLIVLFIAVLALPEQRARLAGCRPTAAWVALAALVLWAALSLIWSINPVRGGLVAARLAGMLVAGGLLACVFARLPVDARRRAELGLALAAAAVIVLLGSEIADQAAIARALRGVALEAFTQSVLQLFSRSAALLAVLVWPLAIALGRRTAPAIAVTFVVLAAVEIFLLPMHAARLGFVVGAGLALACWLAPVWTRRALTAGFVVGVFALPLAVYLIAGDVGPDDIPQRALRSWLHRIEIWQFTIGQIAEHPWIGWGLDTARVMPGGETQAPGQEVGIVLMPLHPHNNVLQLWLELGVVGVTAVAALGALLLRATGRADADPLARAAAVASIGAFLCMALLSYGVWQTWWVVTAWLAVLLFAMLLPADS